MKDCGKPMLVGGIFKEEHFQYSSLMALMQTRSQKIINQMKTRKLSGNDGFTEWRHVRHWRPKQTKVFSRSSSPGLKIA